MRVSENFSILLGCKKMSHTYVSWVHLFCVLQNFPDGSVDSPDNYSFIHTIIHSGAAVYAYFIAICPLQSCPLQSAWSSPDTSCAYGPTAGGPSKQLLPVWIWFKPNPTNRKFSEFCWSDTTVYNYWAQWNIHPIIWCNVSSNGCWIKSYRIPLADSCYIA